MAAAVGAFRREGLLLALPSLVHVVQQQCQARQHAVHRRAPRGLGVQQRTHQRLRDAVVVCVAAVVVLVVVIALVVAVVCGCAWNRTANRCAPCGLRVEQRTHQ